jgi:hypothetical protein
MRAFLVASGVMGLAALAACTADVRFNPSGCEVQVRGQWLVDNQNPTGETCGTIALVELAIIDAPESQFWIAPEFSLRCDPTTDSNAAIIDGGAYIDTRIVTRNRCGGTGEILRIPPVEVPDAGVDAGPPRYKSRWRATTNQKFVVDCSPIESTVLTPIDGETDLLLDVGTVNFQTGDGGVECPSP